MNKTTVHQWINTALLLVAVATLVALWRIETSNTGVQCLEPQNVAQQYFKIEDPAYCVAVAPAHLDRDN